MQLVTIQYPCEESHTRDVTSIAIAMQRPYDTTRYDPRILEAIFSDDMHFFIANLSYTATESENPRK